MIAGNVSGINKAGNDNGGIVPPWLGHPVPKPEPIPTPLPGPIMDAKRGAS